MELLKELQDYAQVLKSNGFKVLAQKVSIRKYTPFKTYLIFEKDGYYGYVEQNSFNKENFNFRCYYKNTPGHGEGYGYKEYELLTLENAQKTLEYTKQIITRYNIPTYKDIDELIAIKDYLEQL